MASTVNFLTATERRFIWVWGLVFGRQESCRWVVRKNPPCGGHAHFYYSDLDHRMARDTGYTHFFPEECVLLCPDVYRISASP